MEKISVIRYPTLSRYIFGLPAGISSYPEVMTTSDLPNIARKAFPEILSRSDLPKDITDVFSSSWTKTRWVPEVHWMALTAALRDVNFKNDEKFKKFCFDTMKESYSGPIMRSLMYVISPSLLAMAAERKWGAYKKGVTMTSVSSSENGRILKLVYPKNIYLTCMLEGMASSIDAALACTKVQKYKTTVEVVSSTECRFIVSWQS